MKTGQASELFRNRGQNDENPVDGMPADSLDQLRALCVRVMCVVNNHHYRCLGGHVRQRTGDGFLSPLTRQAWRQGLKPIGNLGDELGERLESSRRGSCKARRNAWRTVHAPERLLAIQHHVLG